MGEAPRRAGRTAPPVLRRATQEEIRTANELRKSEEDVRRKVIDKVKEHDLTMKVSDAEWQWDRNKLTVYFTAEKRVDFRGLVRDLAGLFRTRIDLRQIGVRDEAARLGGVGRCGREYCCSTWLTELSPVSLSLAKDQHLSLNPQQISGGCGRLLCCLKYEHEFYVAQRKRFPKEGKVLRTGRGSGEGRRRGYLPGAGVPASRRAGAPDHHASTELREEVDQSAEAPPPGTRGTAPRPHGSRSGARAAALRPVPPNRPRRPSEAARPRRSQRPPGRRRGRGEGAAGPEGPPPPN